MGLPAAKQGDKINALDIHNTIVPPATSPIPIPYVFNGIIDGNLSSNVKISGMPAATVDSTATNTPPHIPAGASFSNPPDNKGTIKKGSATVFINKKAAARMGDQAQTCHDFGLIVGTVIASGNVLIGG